MIPMLLKMSNSFSQCLFKHKRYKELSDFDKKNAFDVECYLKHELRLRMDEEFDCYEVDLTPATEEATA